MTFFLKNLISYRKDSWKVGGGDRVEGEGDMSLVTAIAVSGGWESSINDSVVKNIMLPSLSCSQFLLINQEKEKFLKNEK